MNLGVFFANTPTLPTKTFTAVFKMKSPISPIFPKIGPAKEKTKEKKRQVKKE